MAVRILLETLANSIYNPCVGYGIKSFTVVKPHHKQVFLLFLDLIQDHPVDEKLFSTSPTVFPPSSLFYSYNIID